MKISGRQRRKEKKRDILSSESKNNCDTRKQGESAIKEARGKHTGRVCIHPAEELKVERRERVPIDREEIASFPLRRREIDEFSTILGGTRKKSRKTQII